LASYSQANQPSGVQTVNRFAVIITHNRPELLARCVAAVAPQVDAVIVLDNASDPPVTHGQITNAVRAGRTEADLAGLRGQANGCRVVVINEPTQPPDLPLLWRIGLGMARALWCGSNDTRGGQPLDHMYHVAMLCDDAIVPTGWFSTVRAEMIRTGATAGASDPFNRAGYQVLKTAPDNDIMGRMPGHAYMLNASPPEPDSSMRWWWCDTDMDFQARKMHGMVMVGSERLGVQNERPNEYTNTKPELAEQAGRDAAAFVAKWGFRPW
jgi:hypothetical protein